LTNISKNVYIISVGSIIRGYFSLERTKKILSHKKQFISNIPAAINMEAGGA